MLVHHYNYFIKTINSSTIIQIFCKWNGSAIKAIWKDITLFSVLYSIISVIYRNALIESWKQYFEYFCIYTTKVMSILPTSFILGLYVTMVVHRWWIQFKLLPWPDSVAFLANSCISGESFRVYSLRYNIIRYVNASLALFYRSVSLSAKKQFQNEEDLINFNILNEQEFKLLNTVTTEYNRYYVPCLWASRLANVAFEEGHIKSEIRYRTLLIEINDFRENLRKLFYLNWINLPLVYTQTATLAVYIYYVGSLFTYQFLDPSKSYPGHNVDYYVPIFSMLQLAFYFSWLNIGEVLINPFGSDDDDFNCVQFIERNIMANFPILKPLDSIVPGSIRDYKMDEKPCIMNDLINDEYLVMFRKQWKI